jgi:AraC-like DNA-binding protein
MIVDTREVSPDFRATTMLLTERFTDSLNLGNSYRTLLSIQRQPVAQLDEEMVAAMLNFIGMVRGLLRVPSHPNMDRVLHLLFEAWFFGFGPYLHSTESQRVATAAEQHTEEFLRLVEQHFHQHHALDWYAQQLNITPKRLSICVKETSGRTPSEWIYRHRLLAANSLLRGQRLSVKEVAARLGFPNQSAFGTWFKRLAGRSPRNA